MLEKFGLLSVNQLAAQIKLREVWKSIYCEDYPIKLEPYNPALEDGSHSLRPKQNSFFRLIQTKQSQSQLQCRCCKSVEFCPNLNQRGRNYP